MRLCDPISVKTRHIVFMMKLWTFYRKMSSRHERQGISFFYDIYIKLLFCERYWKSNSPKLIRLRFILAVRRCSKLRSSKGTNQNSPFHRGPVQPYDKNLYLTWPTCMILRGSCIARWCWPRMLRPVKDIWARLSPARTKSIIEVTGSDCRYSGYNGKNTSHLVVYPQYHDYL